MAYNGAAIVCIRQQGLSKRAQKFRRLLQLRHCNVNQFNEPKNWRPLITGGGIPGLECDTLGIEAHRP
jgi:hypothetical protein